MSIIKRACTVFSIAAIMMFVLGGVAKTHASIVVVDNGTTLTTTYDETFTLTSGVTNGGSGIHAIVFHNMFADVFTGRNPINEVYSLNARVNGGSVISLSPWGGWNYRAGLDKPGYGWVGKNGLGLLWNENTLGGAMAGDTVQLFGSLTHSKGGFHHLPDFLPTTVEYSAYNNRIFATQNVGNAPPTVPEPATIALLGIGIVGLAGAEARRRRKKKAVDNS